MDNGQWSMVNGQWTNFLERPVADTGSGGDGSQSCGDGSDENLQDEFPDVVLFHSGLGKV